MKITSFHPVIMSTKADDIISLYEELDFKKNILQFLRAWNIKRNDGGCKRLCCGCIAGKFFTAREQGSLVDQDQCG